MIDSFCPNLAGNHWTLLLLDFYWCYLGQ